MDRLPSLITDLVAFLNGEIDRNAREAAELDVARQAAQILRDVVMQRGEAALEPGRPDEERIAALVDLVRITRELAEEQKLLAHHEGYNDALVAITEHLRRRIAD